MSTSRQSLHRQEGTVHSARSFPCWWLYGFVFFFHLSCWTSLCMSIICFVSVLVSYMEFTCARTFTGMSHPDTRCVLFQSIAKGCYRSYHGQGVMVVPYGVPVCAAYSCPAHSDGSCLFCDWLTTTEAFPTRPLAAKGSISPSHAAMTMHSASQNHPCTESSEDMWGLWGLHAF